MKRITDMAVELADRVRNKSGILRDERKFKNGITGSYVQVLDERAAREIGKPVGKYVSFDLPHERVVSYDQRSWAQRFATENRYVAKLVGEELRGFLYGAGKVLVVGLGNNRFVADSLGANVCEGLVTGDHLLTFVPSVSGVTGIKSTTATRAICDAVQPSHVIVVDSLVCSDIKRLGLSFQLGGTGLAPGSGITRDNERLDEGFLGVPVIALGVPMVSIMESHYVVPKTIDAVVARCAHILTEAIKQVKSEK